MLGTTSAAFFCWIYHGMRMSNGRRHQTCALIKLLNYSWKNPSLFQKAIPPRKRQLCFLEIIGKCLLISLSISRIIKIGLKCWTSCLPYTTSAFQGCISSLGSSRLPLMAIDIVVHCPSVPLQGNHKGTKPWRCTGRDVPPAGGPPGFYFGSVCGFISHLALLWSCLHPVSSLLTLACVLAFLPASGDVPSLQS